MTATDNTLDYRQLSGRSFIITGGTQGMGEAVARFAAARGAAGLTICGRNRERGEQVARELSDTGCPCLYVAADLTREDQCRAVVTGHAERFDDVHGLANVAASTARGTLESTSVSDWDAMFALNVRAPFILMQDVVKLMKARGHGGSIVNISSVSGRGGQAFLTGYSTSKGALDILTKNAAHALSGDRIRVNGLNLGWMATPGETAIQVLEGKPENWLEQADASSPFGTILRPDNVAKLVTFLWSDDSMPMTGSLIDYDYQVIGGRD